MLTWLSMCVCVWLCVYSGHLPSPSLDRWHPLALWLACQCLHMLMGAPLQASTFIYKCKFKTLPHPVTFTHLHHFNSDSSGLIWLLPICGDGGRTGTGIASDTAKQSWHATGMVEPGEEMTATECPNQENFVWKPSKKLLTPYFVFHILMICFCRWVLIRTQTKWQASSHSRSVRAVSPKTVI